MSEPLRRAIFLDRDGTLMDEVNYCRDPKLVRAIPGARTALEQAGAAGWLRVIVTNQSGIGSGRIHPLEYEAVQDELLRQLGGGIDAVYFCPDPSHLPTRRRKPGPGMLEEAARHHGVDLGASWMVGDKAIDVEAGRAAGCRTILVKTGYGEGEAGADFTVADVAEAIRTILETSG